MCKHTETMQLRKKAYRLRNKGLTLKSIGIALNKSPERIRQYIGYMQDYTRFK